jgi:DNA-binding MarR family transcriptional regulator
MVHANSGATVSTVEFMSPAGTSSPAAVINTGPSPTPDLVASLSRVMRAFGRAKAAFLSAASHDVDWSAYLLLARIVAEGPIRLSQLAECLHSDVSTASRQVAAMVKDGLLERRADPVDGRASLLVATAKGRTVHAEHNRIRNEGLARMLSAWSDEDRRQFALLMSRFADDVERALPKLANIWQPSPALPNRNESKEF